MHVDPAWQGAGRFDIPGHAVTLYLAETPVAAVGEAFAAVPTWTDDMLWSGYTGRRRYLVEFEHSGPYVELDDAAFLASRGYRPSDVVARNRERSQEIALELWLDGVLGLRWWSYHRPEWRVRSIWAPLDSTQPWAEQLRVTDVSELGIASTPMVVAADVLRRPRS